jgi:hypothetical protein
MPQSPEPINHTSAAQYRSIRSFPKARPSLRNTPRAGSPVRSIPRGSDRTPVQPPSLHCAPGRFPD